MNGKRSVSGEPATGRLGVARPLWPFLLGLVCAAFVLIGTRAAAAAEVVPRAEVRDGVTVRAEPDGTSERVGVLRPNEHATYLSSVPNWHEVQLSNNVHGFVPKRWTVIAGAAEQVPFQLHFLDVGTGDASILDVGAGEMVIDGGDSISVLDSYAFESGVVEGPIELVVVTHGDTDHWRGLTRLLGFDGRSKQAHSVQEFWEPGYNRDCRPLDSYTSFIQKVREQAARFRRPLSETNVPAVVSDVLHPITVPGLPGVQITVLHSDPAPTAKDCAYAINDASIVLLVEVAGVRILFTGDANGKERDGSSTEVGHVEAKLLALEAKHPGILRADILKVPHHGSETASTDAFIAKVAPHFVIISASTKHALPRATVVKRYEAPGRVILRTDRDPEAAKDNIVCGRDENAELTCSYAEN